MRVPKYWISTLVPAYGEAEPGFVGVVLGGHVLTPGAVALLQPKAVERRPACGDHAEVLAGGP
jgi:hypothetical protein